MKKGTESYDEYLELKGELTESQKNVFIKCLSEGKKLKINPDKLTETADSSEFFSKLFKKYPNEKIIVETKGSKEIMFFLAAPFFEPKYTGKFQKKPKSKYNKLKYKKRLSKYHFTGGYEPPIMSCLDQNIYLWGNSGAGKTAAIELYKAYNRIDRIMEVNVTENPLIMQRKLFGAIEGAWTDLQKGNKGELIDFEESPKCNRGLVVINDFQELDKEAMLALYELIDRKEFKQYGGNHYKLKKKYFFMFTATEHFTKVTSDPSMHSRLSAFMEVKALHFNDRKLADRKKVVEACINQIVEEHNYVYLEDGLLELLANHYYEGSCRELNSEIQKALLYIREGCYVSETDFPFLKDDVQDEKKKLSLISKRHLTKLIKGNVKNSDKMNEILEFLRKIKEATHSTNGYSVSKSDEKYRQLFEYKVDQSEEVKNQFEKLGIKDTLNGLGVFTNKGIVCEFKDIVFKTKEVDSSLKNTIVNAVEPYIDESKRSAVVREFKNKFDVECDLDYLDQYLNVDSEQLISFFEKHQYKIHHQLMQKKKHRYKTVVELCKGLGISRKTFYKNV